VEVVASEGTAGAAAGATAVIAEYAVGAAEGEDAGKDTEATAVVTGTLVVAMAAETERAVAGTRTIAGTEATSRALDGAPEAVVMMTVAAATGDGAAGQTRLCGRDRTPDPWGHRLLPSPIPLRPRWRYMLRDRGTKRRSWGERRGKKSKISRVPVQFSFRLARSFLLSSSPSSSHRVA